MRWWHIALLFAYAAACLGGAFAYSQWSAARLAEKTADELRADVVRKLETIEELKNAAKKAEKATATAGALSEKADQERDKRAEAIRAHSSTSRDWLNAPVPDGLRELFCAGNPDRSVDAAGITLDAVRPAKSEGNNDE